MITTSKQLPSSPHQRVGPGADHETKKRAPDAGYEAQRAALSPGAQSYDAQRAALSPGNQSYEAGRGGLAVLPDKGRGLVNSATPSGVKRKGDSQDRAKKKGGDKVIDLGHVKVPAKEGPSKEQRTMLESHMENSCQNISTGLIAASVQFNTWADTVFENEKKGGEAAAWQSFLMALSTMAVGGLGPMIGFNSTGLGLIFKTVALPTPPRKARTAKLAVVNAKHYITTMFLGKVQKEVGKIRKDKTLVDRFWRSTPLPDISDAALKSSIGESFFISEIRDATGKADTEKVGDRTLQKMKRLFHLETGADRAHANSQDWGSHDVNKLAKEADRLLPGWRQAAKKIDPLFFKTFGRGAKRGSHYLRRMLRQAAALMSHEEFGTKGRHGHSVWAG